MVRRLKVCHIASGDVWAGAAVQVATILPALGAESDLRVEAVLFNSGELESRLRDARVQVSVLREATQSPASLALSLYKHLRKTQPDIVHVHGYKEHVLGGWVARTAGVLTVVRTVHGAHEPFRGFAGLKMRLYQNLERVALARCTDWTICVSQSLAIHYNHRGDQGKVSIIPNAVLPLSRIPAKAVRNLRDSLGVEPSQYLIGVVGRLVPIKCVDRFLEVACRLDSNLLNVRFLIVGDGPERKRLQDLSTSLGLSNRVIFLGHVSDVQPYISALDCLLLTSDDEGMPSVALEAMALSVPVIAFRVGGIPELVVDGETGRLVPPADVVSMASSIRELLLDLELRTRYGQSGCERVRQKFSAPVIARQTASLYRRVVAMSDHTRCARPAGRVRI